MEKHGFMGRCITTWMDLLSSWLDSLCLEHRGMWVKKNIDASCIVYSGIDR
jgi:hypothetical protein